jgi:hypothetical protein
VTVALIGWTLKSMAEHNGSAASASNAPLFYDRAKLERLRAAQSGTCASSNGLLSQLKGCADQAMRRGPYSVIDKSELPPSQDPHNYYHPAPYFWPRKYFGRWLPAKRRDGLRVPGTRLYEPESDRYDRTRLQRLLDDTTILALAWSVTAEDRYARQAIRLVETWFVNPETRMNPHLNYAQVRPGRSKNQGSKSGVIEFKDVYFFLDAARVLQAHPQWTDALDQAFKGWMWEYCDWLRRSRQGRAESASKNNHGTCYDLQLGAIAAFLGAQEVLDTVLNGVEQRLLEQFTTEGFQPLEAGRTQTQHYFAFNLQCWLNLAALTGAVGVDLWQLSLDVNRPLERALEYFLSYRDRPWAMPQLDAFAPERFGPLISAYNARQPNLLQLSFSARLNPIMFPHDGVRPFWMLGPEFLPGT